MMARPLTSMTATAVQGAEEAGRSVGPMLTVDDAGIVTKAAQATSAGTVVTGMISTPASG